MNIADIGLRILTDKPVITERPLDKLRDFKIPFKDSKWVKLTNLILLTNIIVCLIYASINYPGVLMLIIVQILRGLEMGGYSYYMNNVIYSKAKEGHKVLYVSIEKTAKGVAALTVILVSYFVLPDNISKETMQMIFYLSAVSMILMIARNKFKEKIESYKIQSNQNIDKC